MYIFYWKDVTLKNCYYCYYRIDLAVQFTSIHISLEGILIDIY